MPSRDKRAVFAELIDEIRLSQSATQRFDQAVADAVGINRTDMACVDVLQRAGPQTAGALADATGLTSGAMTVAIDRLEKKGFARRVRDPSDRRRVVVELIPAAVAAAGQHYEPHQRESERLFQRYTIKELELLLEFVRNGREFNEEQAVALEQRNRRR